MAGGNDQRRVDPYDDTRTEQPAQERGTHWAYRDRRYVYDAEVALIEPALDPPLVGKVTNLSEGGCCIVTHQTLPIDSDVAFELPLEDQVVHVTGRVVWLRRKRWEDDVPAIGVRFEGLDHLEWALLKATVMDLREDRARGGGPPADELDELDYTFTDDDQDQDPQAYDGAFEDLEEDPSV